MQRRPAGPRSSSAACLPGTSALGFSSRRPGPHAAPKAGLWPLGPHWQTWPWVSVCSDHLGRLDAWPRRLSRLYTRPGSGSAVGAALDWPPRVSGELPPAASPRTWPSAGPGGGPAPTAGTSLAGMPVSASSSASGPGHVVAVSGPVPGPAAPPPAAVPAAAATGPGQPCPSDPRPSGQPALSGPLGLLPSGSSQGGRWKWERPPSGGHCHPGPAWPCPPLPSAARRGLGDPFSCFHYGGGGVARGWRASTLP